jgi:hypothetical protein
MRSTVKLMFALAVFASSAAANAQTHDANIDLGKSDKIDFSESLFLDNGFLSDVDQRSPFDLLVFTGPLELGRDKPLEGASNFGMRNVYFGFDGNTPICGQGQSANSPKCSGGGSPGGVNTAVPEIDSRFATEGMLLLAGGLIVLRGRRTLKARALG